MWPEENRRYLYGSNKVERSEDEEQGDVPYQKGVWPPNDLRRTVNSESNLQGRSFSEGTVEWHLTTKSWVK